VEHDARRSGPSHATSSARRSRTPASQAGDVAAVGITNQRETTVVWDKATGEPVSNAIVWQDRRTASFCARLKRDGLEDTIRAKTGLVIDPYFSGSKVHWLLENVDGLRERAGRGELCFGTIDSWLIYKLTGGRQHVTDVTNASRTLLLDIGAVDWDDELLEIFGVPREMLPELRPSSAVYDETDPDAFFGSACRSPARSVTSRRRCSRRPASSRGRRRTRTAPVRSSS
jgi:glycerol kinase